MIVENRRKKIILKSIYIHHCRTIKIEILMITLGYI